jgi:glutamate-1-semialdehyde 2,1-aminomutase
MTQIPDSPSADTAPRRAVSARAAALQERAHALVPGGSHTYAKGDDQYPVLAPGLLQRGRGCRVWDVDDNEFVEYGMGLRAVSLGHGYPDVVAAAHAQMLQGTNFTRPAAIEVECAEALLELVPRADMVKFCKDGSTATTAAVKLARAATGRDLVAVCRDHPFFSYDDWFIGTTEMDAGIPPAFPALSVAFSYNDLESVQRLFDEYPGRIACVILEPERTEEPVDGFLHRLRELCRREGALFVLDEMITGFRWHIGGAQALYGLEPDLSTFGKAMANGFAVSALVGKRELMELGGLRHTGDRVFLLSTTHGAEHHALAAAVATMRIYGEQGVVEALYDRGDRLRAGIEAAVSELGLGEHFRVLGKSPNLVYATLDQEKRPSQPFRTLFLQETIRRGFLLPSLVVSFSHTREDVDLTVEAIADALVVYRRALEAGVETELVGRPVKPVYRRHN